MSNFDKDRKVTGTNEWAEEKHNFQKGCSNGCAYCYAITMALQYGRIKNRKEWLHCKINKKKVNNNMKCNKCKKKIENEEIEEKNGKVYGDPIVEIE